MCAKINVLGSWGQLDFVPCHLKWIDSVQHVEGCQNGTDSTAPAWAGLDSGEIPWKLLRHRSETVRTKFRDQHVIPRSFWCCIHKWGARRTLDGCEDRSQPVRSINRTHHAKISPIHTTYSCCVPQIELSSFSVQSADHFQLGVQPCMMPHRFWVAIAY